MFEKELPERKWLAPEEEIQQLIQKKSEKVFTEKDEERLFELKQRIESKKPQEESGGKESKKDVSHPRNPGQEGYL